MRKGTVAWWAAALAAAGLALGLGAGTARAGTTEWVNPGVGDWFEPANWSAGVPTGSTDAYVANGGTAQVGKDGAEAAGLVVGEDRWNPPSFLEVTAGGEVSSTEGYLGHYLGAQGTAMVTGAGSAWTNSGSLSVGHGGIGTLNVEAGGKASNSYGYLGHKDGARGTVTVTGAGSAWTNSGPLWVGNYGTGTLTVEAGGRVSSRDGYLGYEDGGQGTATVTGAGSAWTLSNDLYVGYWGTGTLTVKDGGKVSSEDDLYVGYDGTGSLNVEAGGKVSSRNGSLGRKAALWGYFGQGTATVTGAGATWMNFGDLEVGRGSLAVRDGGQVIVGGFLRVGSEGSLTLAGGTLDAGIISPAGGATTTYAAGTLRFTTYEGSLENPGCTLGSPDFWYGLTVTGDYTQGPGATLLVEIDGLPESGQFDVLSVGGTVRRLRRDGPCALAVGRVRRSGRPVHRAAGAGGACASGGGPLGPRPPEALGPAVSPLSAQAGGPAGDRRRLGRGQLQVPEDEGRLLERLADLFVRRGVPAHLRSDNAPGFTAGAERRWLVGVQTLCLEPGSPWGNGHIEPFPGKLRDELLNGEIFDVLLEARVLVEDWRVHYNGGAAAQRVGLPAAGAGGGGARVARLRSAGRPWLSCVDLPLYEWYQSWGQVNPPGRGIGNFRVESTRPRRRSRGGADPAFSSPGSSRCRRKPGRATAGRATHAVTSAHRARDRRAGPPDRPGRPRPPTRPRRPRPRASRGSPARRGRRTVRDPNHPPGRCPPRRWPSSRPAAARRPAPPGNPLRSEPRRAHHLPPRLRRVLRRSRKKRAQRPRPRGHRGQRAQPGPAGPRPRPARRAHSASRAKRPAPAPPPRASRSGGWSRRGSGSERRYR